MINIVLADDKDITLVIIIWPKKPDHSIPLISDTDKYIACTCNHLTEFNVVPTNLASLGCDLH